MTTESKSEEQLLIKSRSQSGFRRAGFQFTPEGIPVEIDSLSEQQLEAINNEPELIVETISTAESDE